MGARASLLVHASLIAVAVTFAGVTPVRAEPRFAVRHNAPCRLCHINPTGGSMRRRYARNVFARLKLDMGLVDESFGFSPEIGDMFSFGGDFRLAFIGQPEKADPVVDPANPAPPVTAGLFVGTETPFTFFPMQVDLYAAADLGRHVAFLLDISPSGTFETFALLHDLPLAGYLKAGFFTSPYGTKLPNHTAAVRQPFGFDPRGKDAGIEVGLSPGPLELVVAVQNGELAGVVRDQERGFGLTARASARFQLGPVNFVVGASGQQINTSTEVEENGSTRVATSVERRFGPFLWASLGRFTYVGEAGFLMKQDGTKPTESGAATESGVFVSYQELDYLVVQGLDLSLTYEFMDRDIETTAPTPDTVHRLSVMAQLFPLQFVEIDVIGRYYLARADRAENGQAELLAFIHLFF